MKKEFKEIKESYPKIDNNLKETIINKYDNIKFQKRKYFKLNVILSGLTTCCLILGVAISLCDFDFSFNKYSIEKGESAINSFIESEIAYKEDGFDTLKKIEGLDKYTDITYDFDSKEGIIDSNSTQVSSHSLTASAYNDNLHYNFFKKLCSYMDDQSEGTFKYYYDSIDSFKKEDRIALSFPKGLDGKVSMFDGAHNLIYESYIDNQGYAYLFSSEKLESYNIEIEYLNDNIVYIYSDEVSENKDYTNDETFLYAINHPSNILEIMFVIDTTGSMGDELDYLKAEVKNVISSVAKDNPNALIYTSAIVYRDKDDDYLNLISDFSSNIEDTRKFINNQDFDGGGDLPEDVSSALEVAINASWTSYYSTKLLIHVADAPDHSEKYALWENKIEKIASLGINIITLACSGIDNETQYLFRMQSMLTNGTYCYLTDDSGIGESHNVALTEDTPTVEYVNDMLIRLINGYYSGEFKEPVSYYSN